MYIILTAFLLTLVCGLLSFFYNRNWSKKLSVTLRVPSDGIFEGETGEVAEIISNGKLTPLFWGSIQFRVPGALHFGSSDSGQDYYREDRISVLPYEEVTKKLPFTAAHRGCYRLDDLQLTEGSLSFRYKMMKSFSASPEIYVYPRVKTTKRFKIDYRRIIGDAVARRSFLEDPFFFCGIRDYSPFDSMKKVNWKATARTGSLKVNQYHTTQSQRVMLLLDLDGYNKLDGRQIKEDVISTAAFLARKFALGGTAVGFTTNAADVFSGEHIETECKSGRSHFFLMMRQMAKIDTEKLLEPFGGILENLPRNAASATQYILISYRYSDGLVRQVEALRPNIQWIFLHDKSRRINFVRCPGMYVCEEVRE